jgi:hypothetical protein
VFAVRDRLASLRLPLRLLPVLTVAALVPPLSGGCAATSRYGESLETPLPPGYERIERVSTDGLEHVEMRPAGQRASDWNEMVTTQRFKGGVEEGDPLRFSAWLAGRFRDECPTGRVGPVEASPHNGYPSAFWRMDCDRMVATGRPEHTLTLAVEGTYAFYTVQKTWRSDPPEQEIASWIRDFFGAVRVCDRRAEAGHPCGREGLGAVASTTVR